MSVERAGRTGGGSARPGGEAGVAGAGSAAAQPRSAERPGGQEATSAAFVPTTGRLASVLVASTLVQCATSTLPQTVPPLAPSLMAEFDLTRAQIGLCVSCLWAGSTVTLLLARSLPDRTSVRRLYLVGLLICAAVTLLAAAAPGLPVFLLALGLGGAGTALALPATARAIVEWFAGPRLGAMMSIKQTGFALTGTLCGLTLPSLAGTIGWRPSLALVGGALGLLAYTAYTLYRDHPARTAPPTPPPHEQSAGRRGVDRPRVGDRRARPATIAGLPLWRNPNVRRLALIVFLFGGVQQVAITFLVLFLSERLGLSVVAAGGLLALAQAVGAFSRVGWGVASDTLAQGRRRPVMALVSALSGLAILALSFASAETPEWLLVPLVVLLGSGAIGWNGVTMTMAGEITERARVAEAASLIYAASNLGLIVMPPLFGLAVDMSGSYTLAYRTVAAALLANVVLVLTLRERGRALG